MTTNYHTPLAGTDDLNSITFNTVFSALDSAITGVNAAIQNTIQATLGEGVAANDAGYIDLSDGMGYLLDADASTPKAGVIRGFWVDTVSASGTGTLQISGIMSGFSGLTARLPVYVGTLAGGITQTRPSPTSGGAQVAIMQMGIAISATEVFVNPLPIQYQLRDAMADTDTLTINHHPDANGYKRNVWAYITESPDPFENLEAWWALDEASGNRADSHGSNTLTDNNTVLAGTGLNSTNAADFEASNSEYLSIADNASLSMGDIDFSVSAWVNLESKTDGGIVTKWGGTATEYLLYYNAGLDRFVFSVNDGSSSGTVQANSLGSPSVGTWYFIVAWHDSVSNTINIQVNNGTANSAAWSTGVQDSTQAFRIGVYSAAQYFDGLIETPFVVKDVLSSSVKTWLYNSGAGRVYADLASAPADIENPARVSVDWWSSTHADMVNRYGDGAGADLDDQTTFKCVRASGFDDITVVVEIP